MEKLLSLGELYLNDFLKPGEDPGQKYELSLVMDESCGAARLEKVAPLDKMYGKYWYRSGTNESMKAALKDVVDSVLPHINKGNWLDIACNDGTLLSVVPDSFIKHGADPADGAIHDEACKHGIIDQTYFRKELFLPGYKINVITTIAMFYDLEKPDKFCKDVYEVMADDGLWVIQMSYTPLMIKQLAFDNICHEHVYYHTLGSMKIILERNGFEIVDCTLNEVNGGSLRLFVKKKGQPFATQPYRDVCNMRMEGIARVEKKLFKDGAHMTWLRFARDIKKLREQTLLFIMDQLASGKTVMAYGASTKGNTLLQYFGLDNTLITAIAEKQEGKWGLVTPGTNIPIISEEEMRKAKPDYLLILPWHFIGEFREREKEYLNGGGKFIVPCPKFEII